MVSESPDTQGPKDSPHLTGAEVQKRLEELESATDHRRIDLMTELAWRPAWAIRSRRGVISMIVRWWKARNNNKS